MVGHGFLMGRFYVCGYGFGLAFVPVAIFTLAVYFPWAAERVEMTTKGGGGFE